jgi:SAM-dependent methyltransferase
MNIDRPRIFADLDAMRIDMAQPHLQAMFDALVRTDADYAGLTPQSIDLHSYLVGMMAFASRLPAEALRPGARVLDVGAGHGRLLMALKSAFGVEAYGLDKAAYAGGERQQLWAVHDRAGLKILSPFDIEKQPLPYPDGFFDLATCQQAIEHFHDTPKVVLDDVFRVLKPGAGFVLDTPNHAYWGYHIRMLRGESVHCELPGYYNHRYSTGPRGEHYGHKREFTMDELKSMLEWSGFEVVSAETAMYAPGAEDLSGALKHYLHEVRQFLAAEYEAHLSHPSEEEIARAGPKMERLRDTAILVGRKP